MGSANPKVNRGGRPPVSTDTEALAVRAIGVLDRHGYATTTMAELAGHLGMSVRTLHRYFPSKSDIVLKPVDGTLLRIASRLNSQAPSTPAIQAIRAAVEAILAESANDWMYLRTALKLVATNPELSWAPQVRTGDGTLQSFLASRTVEGSPSAMPEIVAAAASAVTVNTLIWWAQHDESEQDPRAIVDLALAGLEAGFGRYFTR